jgi:hypothetical protein
MGNVRIAAAAIAALVASGVGLGVAHATAPQQPPPPPPAPSQCAPDNQDTPDVEEPEPSGPDTDNLQEGNNCAEGDQNAPDTVPG